MKTLLFVAIATVACGMARCKPMQEDYLIKPNSAKGFIAVVNQQKLVPECEFASAFEILQQRKQYVIDFTKQKDATVTIHIVDKPGEPPMTVSPEAGIGILNVAALTNDLTTATSVKKFLFSRARKEFLRTIAYSFAVGGSQFKGNIMSATSIRDLDYAKEALPVDVIDKIDRCAKTRGMRPRRIADYESACMEGWAPAPTNDVQKAIWERVHALPKNPIKINPETKKVEK